MSEGTDSSPQRDNLSRARVHNLFVHCSFFLIILLPLTVFVFSVKQKRSESHWNSSPQRLVLSVVSCNTVEGSKEKPLQYPAEELAFNRQLFRLEIHKMLN